jgi:hypothetical protein
LELNNERVRQARAVLSLPVGSKPQPREVPKLSDLGVYQALALSPMFPRKSIKPLDAAYKESHAAQQAQMGEVARMGSPAIGSI